MFPPIKGFLLDITERKQAEIRNPAAQFASLLVLNSIGQNADGIPWTLSDSLHRTLKPDGPELFSLDTTSLYLFEQGRHPGCSALWAGRTSFGILKEFPPVPVKPELMQSIKTAHADVPFRTGF